LDRIGVERRSQVETQEIAQLQNPDSPHTDEEWLKEQYVEKGLTQDEIAEDLPVSAGAVSHWLHKFGIKTRSKTEWLTDGDLEPLQDAGWLREQYREKRRTVHEIGDELGVAHSTVLRYLEEHGIETFGHSEMMTRGDIDPLKSEEWLREQYWEEGRSVADIADELGISSTPVRTWMRKHGIDTRDNYQQVQGETLRKLEDAEWLREQYCDEGLTLDKIAEDLNVSSRTVRRWMEDHSIERRDSGHSLLLNSELRDRHPDRIMELLRDEEWLREQYVDEKRSTHQIGDELGVNGSTVGRWMEKHGIERRSNRVANSIRQSDVDLSQLRDADWLRERYWDEEMSAYEIAEEVGTTDNTVRSWMDRHGIEVRAADLAYSMGLSDGDISDLRDGEWLRENYVEKERSMSEIAEEFDVSTVVVRRWLRKNDIETRSLSEATQGINTEERTKQLRDKDWLLTEYSVRCRSAPEIAQQLGVATTTVFYYLDKHDIEVRSSYHDPDHLDHVVRSTWELDLANALVDVGVDYSYESLKIEYGKDRIYIPDFVTNKFVIEVKGRLFEDGSEVEKAEAALDALEERQYVVVGAELPADIHIEWEDRAKVIEVLES
jgi:DNA-directed RNA polymerase specialized sigma24 family protein